MGAENIVMKKNETLGCKLVLIINYVLFLKLMLNFTKKLAKTVKIQFLKRRNKMDGEQPHHDDDKLFGEIRELINRSSRENVSQSPDFILANYLLSCLKAFELATQQRETWYGRDARPSSITVKL